MDSPSSSSRPWRMTFIVIAEILVSAAMWFALFWVTQRSRMINPFFDWRILGVLAATFSQLLMLAVITALWDFKRSTRWLSILAILLAVAVLLPCLMILSRPHFSISQMGPSFLLDTLSRGALILGLLLTIGVISVLFLHVLLWPVHSMLGWRVHWTGEPIPPAKPQFTLWHLLVWTTLIGAMLSLGRTVAEFDSWKGITTFVLLWGIAALPAGLPLLVVATRRKRFLLWLGAGIAWLALVSVAESELTFMITKSTGTGIWIPVWLLVLCNGSVAASVLFHVLLLRWMGIVFDLRLPFSKADPERGLDGANTTVSCPVT